MNSSANFVGDPLVSVVMPAYKTAGYIRASIDSILAQTFTDFELVVVDDCSPDDTAEICRSYTDPRIRLVTLAQNRGLAGARNAGMEVARGELIAFLDSDDIAVPERLALQVDYFARHPECVVLGGGYRRMLDTGELLPGSSLFELPDEAVRPMLLLRNYFNASTLTVRRSAVPEGGFRHMFSEDYDFLSRIMTGCNGGMANLPVVLAHYRINPGSLSNTTKRDAVRAALWEIQRPMLERLGLTPTEAQKELHLDISFAAYDGLNLHKLKQLNSWFREIIEANGRSNLFEPRAIKIALGEVWFLSSYTCAGSGVAALRTYFAGCVCGLRRSTVLEHVRFIAKCLLRRGYVVQQNTKLGIK